MWIDVDTIIKAAALVTALGVLGKARSSKK